MAMIAMGSRNNRGSGSLVAGLLAALLLCVSLIATSPSLHEALHCHEDESAPHVCLLTQIRDGHLEFPVLWQPALEAFEGAALPPAPVPTAPDFKPPPHRLPWALSPPVIG